MASISRRRGCPIWITHFRDADGKQHGKSTGTDDLRIAELISRQYEAVVRGLCPPKMAERIAVSMHTLLAAREAAERELEMSELLAPVDGHEASPLIGPKSFRTLTREEDATLDLDVIKMPKIPSLPDGSGVYFLLQGHRVVYVGQSTELSQRIIDHFKDKVFDGVVCLPVEKRELLVTETFYTAMYKPPPEREKLLILLRQLAHPRAYPWIDAARVIRTYLGATREIDLELLRDRIRAALASGV